ADGLSEHRVGRREGAMRDTSSESGGQGTTRAPPRPPVGTGPAGGGGREGGSPDRGPSRPAPRRAILSRNFLFLCAPRSVCGGGGGGGGAPAWGTSTTRRCATRQGPGGVGCPTPSGHASDAVPAAAGRPWGPPGSLPGRPGRGPTGPAIRAVSGFGQEEGGAE